MMKGYLAQKYKVNVSQKRVANALRSVAPKYNARRQSDTARHVNSVPYTDDYFRHKLPMLTKLKSSKCMELFMLLRLMVTPAT